MATKKFTILELHLDDGSIRVGPATIGEESANEMAEPETEDPDESEGGGSCPARTVGRLLLAVLVLAVLALGIKKVLDGGEDLDELEDLAELDAEAREGSP